MKQLREELQQSRPFSSLEEEAALNIARTAAVLEHGWIDLLRKHGLTPTQYNVLRILRGAGEAGLCRNDVRDRLVALVPDTTRLLDRMAEMGLVVRVRGTADRRYVTTRITQAGLHLLATLDGPVTDAHRRCFAHMSRSDLEKLIRLLELARNV